MTVIYLWEPVGCEFSHYPALNTSRYVESYYFARPLMEMWLFVLSSIPILCIQKPAFVLHSMLVLNVTTVILTVDFEIDVMNVTALTSSDLPWAGLDRLLAEGTTGPFVTSVPCEGAHDTGFPWDSSPVWLGFLTQSMRVFSRQIAS